MKKPHLITAAAIAVSGQVFAQQVPNGAADIPVSSKEGEEAAEPIKVPGLEVLNLGVDRRMLVNRQRKIKMYRCWMQGRFRKAKDEPVKDGSADA